ncbi:PAS domain S-box protein [Sphingomonas floccifaciens]|uniref:histidine kinase n=1 Tax=Sphingomonas floccifaciens TaxID=1844115 RepID=A0ABW4NDX5_9SPHN
MSSTSNFPIAGGETGALMRAHDWSASPLGHPNDWPQSLKSVVGLLLSSKFPMFVAWGERLGFLYNDAYAEILGSKHPTALGAPFHGIWAEIWPDISPLVDAAMAGEAVYRENLPLVLNRRGFDEQAHFTFSYSPVRDEAGHVAGLFCAVAETTSAVVAERAVRESQARFRNMADHAPVMMWVTDAGGVCTYLNRRWYEFTGQAASAGEGDGWLDAVHPDDRAAARQALARAYAEQADYRVDFRLRRHDGSYRWVIDAAAARFNTDGRFLGYVGSVIDIDDRKDIEDALQDSESRLRLALDGAKLGTWDWDLRTMRGTWSPRTVEILGVSDGEDVTVERRSQSIHPDDRGRVWRELSDVMQAGDDLNSEYRVLRPDGEVRWIASRGSMRRDEDGRPIGMAGVVMDVTARARADIALRELNETLEHRVAQAVAEHKVLADIVESTDASVQAIDRDFRFIAINEPARQDYEDLFGVSPVVGQSLTDTLAHLPSERDAAHRAWRRALEGETYQDVAWWGASTHERRAFEMRFQPLLDDAGEVVGAHLFGRDITDHLLEQARLAAAEAARREADALYRAYFENTAEALFVIGVRRDGGFVIEDLNPAHQATIGLPLADVAGKRIDDVLSPDLADAVLLHYRRAIEADGVYQYREQFELHGRETYWDTVLVPVRDADGRIVRLIGASRDLTTQLAAEEQLRQSQKLEAIGTLVGGVAHDINNLLSPIVGGLDLLQRRGVGDDRMQRLVDGAMQSAERARILVQRLLGFARRQPLQPVAIDVRDLILGMADLIRSTSGPRITLNVALASDLPAVQADANQLEMAVLNLSVNARDAMPDGGRLTLAVGLEQIGPRHRSGLPGGRYVRISVSDTGTGMDTATMKRAVEPFFSTKGVGHGTGLGLSMAHGLAAQLGGALAIRSKVGLGTTVEMWLPIAQGQPAKSAADAKIGAKVGAGVALVVDDEHLVRTTTAAMLADLGYSVREAQSAEDALRLVDEGLDPDLVVTDHLMPGMNGADLARKLRRRRPELKVLIVSGFADVDSITPDLDMLRKPFRATDLVDALNETGRGRHIATERHVPNPGQS